MAITFPRAMPSRGINLQRFELKRSDHLSPVLSGAVGSVTAGWPLWEAVWSWAEMDEGRSAEWHAWIDSLRGSQRLFYGCDQMRRVPRAYRQSGLPAGFSGNATSWSVNSTREVVTLNGLPAGFKLLPNDYIGFEWGSTKCTKVKVLEAGTGTSISVTVEPAVPNLVPASAVARVKDPRCLMRLTPDTALDPIGVTRSLPGTLLAIQSLIP